MDNDKMWQAVKDCDASLNGRFFYAAKTTGICCRQSSKPKLPKRDNVVFFATKEDAERAGYRPCRLCRPDLARYNPAIELAEKMKKLLDQHFNDRLELNRALEEMGVSHKHLAQIFKQQYNMTPTIYRQIFASSISRDVIDTPIGGLRTIASDDAILCVERTTRKDQEVNAQAGKAPDDQIMPGTTSGELVKACEMQLQEYFSGARQTFNLPVKLEGTDFQKNIWRHLQDILYGETRTYGELAAMAGNSKASRAVGMANHCNPILILIPCHRVVASDGSLTGYAAGIEAKKYLLSMEKRFAVAKN